MPYERIGHTGYHLYRLGWQHSRYQTLSPLLHLMLSSLRHYRCGFHQAQAWSQQLIRDRSFG